MKQAVLVITLSLFAVSVTAYAQDVTIPANIERLAAKASDTVNITIDGALLQLAAKFLSNEPEEQGVKRLIECAAEDRIRLGRARLRKPGGRQRRGSGHTNLPCHADPLAVQPCQCSCHRQQQDRR